MRRYWLVFFTRCIVERRTNLHPAGGRQVGGLPWLTGSKTELINDYALESNKEVTETLNHVWSLTSLMYCANYKIRRQAPSSQQIPLFHQQETVSEKKKRWNWTRFKCWKIKIPCPKLYASKMFSFDPIQTAVCWHKQKKPNEHRFTTQLNTERLTFGSVRRAVNKQLISGKTAASRMNQDSVICAAKQWRPQERTRSPGTEMLTALCTHVDRQKINESEPQPGGRGFYFIYQAVKMPGGCRRWQTAPPDLLTSRNL